MKKILSLALAAAMAVAALPVAYAAENEADYSAGTQITLVGTQENQGAQWTVTVPAKMQPGQTGTVTAQGTWAADQFINVHAPKTVTLTYGAQSMDVGITFGKSCGFSKIGSNTEDVTYSADITVAEANRLFGTWEGIIEYEVKLIENGDVNQDGVIDNADSAIIDKHIITDPDRHVDLTDEQKIYADLNGDGDYDSIDSAIINKAVVNICNHDAVNAVQPVETVLVGDVNGDGSIDIGDATLVNRLVKNTLPEGTEIALVAADANGDKVINAVDAEMINNYVAENVSVDGSIIGQYRQDVDNSEYTIEYTTNE